MLIGAVTDCYTVIRGVRCSLPGSSIHYIIVHKGRGADYSLRRYRLIQAYAVVLCFSRTFPGHEDERSGKPFGKRFFGNPVVVYFAAQGNTVVFRRGCIAAEAGTTCNLGQAACCLGIAASVH